MEKTEVEMLKEEDIYVISDGSTVKRKTDGVTGIIEKFYMRLGYGNRTYNCYYVRWCNGNLGIVNEDDFEY